MDRWTSLADLMLERMQDLFDKVQQLSKADLLEGIVWVDDVYTDADFDAFRNCTLEDTAILARLLEHPLYRHAVKHLVLATHHIPEPLLRPMVLAGARTIDPSYNHQFIGPCVMLFGRRPVVTLLLDIAMNGSNALKAGATHALYWAQGPRELQRCWKLATTSEQDAPADDPIDDLMDRFEDWALDEFTRNESVEVRRALLPHAFRGRARNPDRGTLLVALGRDHPDDYIRQRTAVELGESRLFPCVPHRTEAE